MVGIRRSAPRLRGVGKSSKGSSSRSLLGYAPIVLVGLVAVYGITMLITLSGSSSSGVRGASGGPMSVSDVLKNSHAYLPKKEVPPAKDLANLAAVPETPLRPPPPVQKYDHHLEDPDIHMLHPDAEKEPARQGSVEIAVDGSRGAPIHHIVLDKKGTGSTNVAYVQDFQYDRQNPTFRGVDLKMIDSATQVARLVQEFKVTSCKSVEKIHDGHYSWTMQAPCLDPDTPQIAYNPTGFDRIWCGQEIAPGKAVIMSEHCTDPTVHLFPVETPPSTGTGMPPMILQSHSGPVNDASQLQTVECDIPCKQEPGLRISEDNLELHFHGENWMITQTLADSYMNNYAKIERTDYRIDHYYSTQSFKSSVPLTYYDPEKFSLRNRPPISFDSAKPKAIYLIDTMCGSPGSKRQKYFAAIANRFSVDSMGDCHHNTDVPPGMTKDTFEGRIELMKQYRFVLAFDPTKEKDHISPVVWEALISGSVPVIVSADNIRSHLPPNSFIDSGMYSDWDDLADGIKKINDNKEQWESYHAWRTDEVALAKFEALYEFSKTDPTCRLCRWGYAKKYGLGWDHATQKVTENHLPRSLCTTATKGLASRPFQEEWISRNEENAIVVNIGDDPGSELCTETLAEATIDNGSTYKIQRTLSFHDGVTDILVTDIERESPTQELVLRLHFPGVQNSDGAHFVNTHTTVRGMQHTQLVSSASMQDDYSKITVLADWATSISCPMEGVLELVVVEAHENEEQASKPLWPNIPRRIRVITEDMNVIHDKMTEYFPSSFATKLIRDFVDPLEVYFADA